jgi:hypothetical protein
LEFVDMPLLHALPWPADLPNAGTQTERTTSINHGNTDDRRQRKSVSARDQVAGLVVSVPVLERQIEHERTARGGYALFEARWRESGHADEDWFQAEMELRSCEGSRQNLIIRAELERRLARSERKSTFRTTTSPSGQHREAEDVREKG